jgi:hypothetical protein
MAEAAREVRHDRSRVMQCAGKQLARRFVVEVSASTGGNIVAASLGAIILLLVGLVRRT